MERNLKVLSTVRAFSFLPFMICSRDWRTDIRDITFFQLSPALFKPARRSRRKTQKWKSLKWNKANCSNFDGFIFTSSSTVLTSFMKMRVIYCECHSEYHHFCIRCDEQKRHQDTDLKTGPRSINIIFPPPHLMNIIVCLHFKCISCKSQMLNSTHRYKFIFTTEGTCLLGACVPRLKLLWTRLLHSWPHGVLI